MNIINFFTENANWIFSGIGVFVITYLFNKRELISNLSFFRWIKYLLKQKNYSIDSSKDVSQFVEENPPDGSRCCVGEKFKKAWTIRNAGCTIWRNRYLKCDPASKYVEISKKKVNMPTVYPGQEYTLEVEYIFHCDGDYFSYWKMYDENNNIIYPDIEGLGVMVHVVKDKFS